MYQKEMSLTSQSIDNANTSPLELELKLCVLPLAQFAECNSPLYS